MPANISETFQKCQNEEMREWVGSSGSVGFLLLKCGAKSLGCFKPALTLPWCISSG